MKRTHPTYHCQHQVATRWFVTVVLLAYAMGCGHTPVPFTTHTGSTATPSSGTAPSRDAETSDDRVGQDTLLATLFWAAAGASLAVSVGYGIAALSASGGFDDRPSYTLAERAEHRATVSGITLGLAVSFGLLGTFSYLGEIPDSETATQDTRDWHDALGAVELSPFVHHSGGGAAVSGHF